MNQIYETLSQSVVFVTGATGYLGRALVEKLVSSGQKIQVVALVRSLEKAKTLSFPPSVILVEGDIREPLSYQGKVDYIIHGASVTASQDFVNHPLETMAVSLDGTKQVLEFALKKKVKKVVYLSSMEVYGVKNYGNEPVSEEDYGYLDLLDPRNSYPQSKRMCETLCVGYYHQKQVPVVMARLTQVFGGAVDPEDKRMFASFLNKASQGENLVLKTQGTTVRGYCHLEDTLTALVTLLGKGSAGESYNVCNQDLTMSVRELAEKIASFYGTCVVIEEDNSQNLGYLPPFRLVLSGEKLMNLGWKPEISLENALALHRKESSE